MRFGRCLALVCFALLITATPASAYPIVISEVQARGDGASISAARSDEYVELFNVSDQPVTLTSEWALWVGNSGCLPRVHFSGQVIPPRKRVLLTGQSYNGAVAGDAPLGAGGLQDQDSGNPGSGVALGKSDGSAFMDAVGWAFLVGGNLGSVEAPCLEGSPSTVGSPITGDASFTRKGADNSQDTGDNGSDFDYAAGGTPQNLASPAVTAAPRNRTAPEVSGTPRENETLTATSGVWQGGTSHSYTYNWLRCDGAGANCADTGAAGVTYVLTGADVGSTIRARVTAANGDGSATQDSAATGTVAAAPVVVVQPPVTPPGPEIPGPEITPTPPVVPPPVVPPSSQCVVPKLKGRTLSSARKALTKSRCRLGKVSRRKTSRKNVGKVLSQKTRAGTRMAEGAKVALVVGKRR